MFTFAGLFILLAAVFGTGSMVGVFAWMLHRIKRLEYETESPGQLQQVRDEIEELREQLILNRNDVAELSERIDFTERLLSRGDSAD